jgi:hypothetical protein
MTFSVLCESPRERHPRRSVPRSVFAAMSLSAFTCFLAQIDCGIEISHGPVAQWNESATLRRSRTHVQIVPGPPISYGVAEWKGGESLKLVYVGSNPTSVANIYAGVAQLE